MKRLILGLIALVFRLISKAFSYWKVLLIVALCLLDIKSPHVRWDYTYYAVINGKPVYASCRYLGVKGIVVPRYTEGCPVIILFNPANERRI